MREAKAKWVKLKSKIGRVIEHKSKAKRAGKKQIFQGLILTGKSSE